MKRMIYIGLSLILFVALLPVAAPFVAGSIAAFAGCDLDEGSIHPCLIGGADRGAGLYALAMTGWLGLVTLPFAGVAGGIISVLALSDLIRYLWRRTRRR